MVGNEVPQGIMGVRETGGPGHHGGLGKGSAPEIVGLVSHGMDP